MSEFSTEIAKSLEFNNPGPLDKNRGPYATKEIACQKIPNIWKVIDGVNRSFREGKIVDIGVQPTTIPYHWFGGYEDENLVPLIEVTYSNLEGKILSDNYKFDKIDRPDLDAVYSNFVEVDSEYKILNSPSQVITNKDQFDRPDLSKVFVDMNDKIIEETSTAIQSENDKIIGVEGIDRPDLPFVILDKDDLVIFQPKDEEESSDSVVVEPQSYLNEFFEPPAQQEFETVEPVLIDYNALIAQWDAIMAEYPTNAGIDPYITKTEIGRTSIKNLPIYRYDFKPPAPKYKFLLMAGVHASEKVYIKLVLNLFKLIAGNWTKDKALQFYRWDVHFSVIPCVSPSSYNGILPGKLGGRRVHETDPIPVSWTKSGFEVTLTFNVANFPATNGRLNGATYFSGVGIDGKLTISVFDSSDLNAVPVDGYKVKSVVNGTTVTFETPTSGNGSGTAKMYVGVDPNRNMNVEGSDVWENFVAPSANNQYSNDYAPSPNENKGTKPFSLAETRMLKQIFDNEKFNIIMDCHSGAGDNYLALSDANIPFDYPKAAEKIRQAQGQFSSANLRVITHSSAVPFFTTYMAVKFKRPVYTIEWTQPATLTPKVAADALRWMTICINELLTIKK